MIKQERSIFTILSIVIQGNEEFSLLKTLIANDLGEAIRLCKDSIVQTKGAYDSVQHPVYTRLPLKEILTQEGYVHKTNLKTESKLTDVSKMMKFLINSKDEDLVEKIKPALTDYEIKYINEAMINDQSFVTTQ